MFICFIDILCFTKDLKKQEVPSWPQEFRLKFSGFDASSCFLVPIFELFMTSWFCSGSWKPTFHCSLISEYFVRMRSDGKLCCDIVQIRSCTGHFKHHSHSRQEQQEQQTPGGRQGADICHLTCYNNRIKTSLESAGTYREAYIYHLTCYRNFSYVGWQLFW